MWSYKPADFTVENPPQFYITGNIESLKALIHIKLFGFYYCNAICGSIETCFANMYKLVAAECVMTYQYARDLAPNNWASDIVFRGNISVFADKYNMTECAMSWHSHINGELKSLKNLKKLDSCLMRGTSVTGSKSDLYNNGANLKQFNI